MKINVLVSISSETENLYDIRFLCSLVGNKKSCGVTLFHIESSKGNSQSSLMSMWDNPNEKKEQVISASAREVINQ